MSFNLHQSTALIQFSNKSGLMCNITKYSMRSYKKRVILGPTHKQYYFFQDKYPTVNGFEGQGFKNFTKDLIRTDILSGFEIFKRGKYPGRYLNIKKSQRFSCCKCMCKL